MLNIQTLTVGDLTANCYLVTDPATSDTLIIDPGDDADFITETIINQKLKPTAIILTHGHFDHVLGCLELKLNFNLPIYLHQADAKLYTGANRSAAHWLKKKSLKVPPADQFIKEGDEIKIGDESLTVIETPGHTPGSISLYSTFPSPILGRGRSVLRQGEGSGIHPILFTGDTLFADGVGRTDFSYSSPLQLTKSLDRLFKLPGETTIYPGHGEPTTVGVEKPISF